MIKGRDFIITSLQRWDVAIGSNIKDIALEISKDNRVLFVNTPLQEKHETKFLLQEIVKDKLWVVDVPVRMLPVQWLPDGFLFDWVNKYNQKRLYKYVRKAQELLNFQESILLIDNDIYRSFYAVDMLKPSFSLYYRRDNLVSHYWRRHAPRLEPLLSGKCDCVIANTQMLADKMYGHNDHLFDVGQGVDLTSYVVSNLPLPEDMPEIPKPIVGYVGMITSLRLDADLVCHIAENMPECSFVMVGEEDSYFSSHRIHKVKNVYFLGHKSGDKIPAYIAAFDICINPQKVNEITVGNYPRKIDEYLAMGKPVVATLTPAMKMFQDYVYCCSNEQEWISSIRQILKNGTNFDLMNRRIEFAHSHSWKESVNKIYSCISTLIEKR